MGIKKLYGQNKCERRNAEDFNRKLYAFSGFVLLHFGMYMEMLQFERKVYLIENGGPTN